VLPKIAAKRGFFGSTPVSSYFTTKTRKNGKEKNYDGWAIETPVSFTSTNFHSDGISVQSTDWTTGRIFRGD
jgi:hypothetical protein